MREAVLLKVPGVKMVRIEELTKFINSHANRPFDDKTAPDKQSEYKRYVKILDMKISSPKEDSDPGYDLSIQILAEFGVRDNKGGDTGYTTRQIIGEVFDRLGIFPNIAA